MATCDLKNALTAACVLLAVAMGVQAQVGVPATAPDDVTVITSERLTFDYRQQFALFERDVVVVDPELRLSCDRLVVWFDDDGQARLIKAEGNVRMTQEDKIAEAGEATYDLEKSRIVLTKNPRVQQGNDFLEGTVITYYVETQVMICEPQAKLVIFPKSDGGRSAPLLAP